MNVGDTVFVQQSLEFLAQVNVFSSTDWSLNSILDGLHLFGELPRQHVFIPGEGEAIQRTTQANAAVEANVTEVVNGNWNSVTKLFTDHPSVFSQVFDSFLSDLRSGEGVHQVWIGSNGGILN